MISRFLDSARRGYQGLPFNGSGGQYGFGGQEWSVGSLWGLSDDKKPAWQNSAVGACIGWCQAASTEPLYTVKRRVEGDPDGEPVNHPVNELLAAPNADLSWHDVLGALILSDMVEGNAYLYKERSTSGKVIGLRYLPHYTVFPQWPADGSVFISHYLVASDTGQYDVPKDDIIHIRNGIDPERTRYGCSPIKPILAEVLTDNEATTYTRAILANMGIVGALMMPKDGSVTFSDEQRKKLGAGWREKFTSGGRGGLAILSDGVDLKEFGATPEKMVLDRVRQLPTKRICAAYRLPSAVVGLSPDDPTYSNLEGYIRAAWLVALLPMLRRIAGSIWRSLEGDVTGAFRDDSLYLDVDVSGVMALQVDVNLEADRLLKLFLGNGITRAELRKGTGFSPGSGDDVFIQDILGTTDALKDELAKQLKDRMNRQRELYESIQELVGNAAEG